MYVFIFEYTELIIDNYYLYNPGVSAAREGSNPSRSYIHQ